LTIFSAQGIIKKNKKPLFMNKFNLNYWGYARVSSEDQRNNSSLDTQTQALLNHGVPKEHIITEVISGEAKVKPKLEKLCETLSPDSTLIVVKLDRFARNTLTALQDIEKLKQRRINFVALDIGSGSDPATYELTLSIFLSLAQFETRRRRDRQAAGIEAAKKQGKYLGRKSVLTPEVLRDIELYVHEKKISAIATSRILNLSRTTVYKGLSYINKQRLENKINAKVKELIKKQS
jgi:DNA invertase Pin-like site-specific DNA recombinase